MDSRWLVLSNCQCIGLGNCLSVVVEGIRVECHDVNANPRDEQALGDAINQYDRIIVSPEVLNSSKVDFGDRSKVTIVPQVLFHGLHPDLTYIKARGVFLRGPMLDYHSAILLTAYKLGLSKTDAKTLFNSALFARLGFFSGWEREKAELCSLFTERGIDILSAFTNWTRHGVFMHSINHPHIGVLRDIAQRVGKSITGRVRETKFLPHDNLAAGPVYPVYPEVAERFSLSGGSYLFKPPHGYTMIDLEQFIEGSYALYADYRPDELFGRGAEFENIVQNYVGLG